MSRSERLRLIADDLTGALDSAASFATPGAPVPVTWSVAEAFDGSFALSTETRDATAEEARFRTIAAAEFVASLPGEALVYKKLDSLLRGHPALELAVMIERVRPDRVVLAPAHPTLGRITRSGWQFVRDAATGREVRVEIDLVTALHDLGYDIARNPIETSDRPRIILADAETQGDLQDLVARERGQPGRVLWCGSGGLAEALAGGAKDLRPLPSGNVLAIVGSDHPNAIAQIEMIEHRLPGAVMRIGVTTSEDVEGPIASRTARLPVTVVIPSPAETTRAAAARIIADTLRNVLPRIAPPEILYVSGGETLRAACDAIGAAGLVCEGFVAPGIPISRLHGGVWTGTATISKSGAFGTPDTLADLFRLHETATLQPQSSHRRDQS
jgi:uncharacterized protein YgbK (DUF1537 family)